MAAIQTRVSYETNWILVLLMFFFTGNQLDKCGSFARFFSWLSVKEALSMFGILLYFSLLGLCCLLAFCIAGLKDAVHSCPSCQNKVGRKNVI